MKQKILPTLLLGFLLLLLFGIFTQFQFHIFWTSYQLDYPSQRGMTYIKTDIFKPLFLLTWLVASLIMHWAIAKRQGKLF